MRTQRVWPAAWRRARARWRRVAVAQLWQWRTSSTYSNSRVWTKSLKASLSVQLPHNACCSCTPELTSAFTRLSNWSGFTCSSWHKISWMRAVALALEVPVAMTIRTYIHVADTTFLHLHIAVNHCRYMASLGRCSKYSILFPSRYTILHWLMGPCYMLFFFLRVLMHSWPPLLMIKLVAKYITIHVILFFRIIAFSYVNYDSLNQIRLLFDELPVDTHNGLFMHHCSSCED